MMKFSAYGGLHTGILMRIAYIDAFSGISGDMLLGAMVDAGVPLELLQKTTRALNLGAELEAKRVERNGIAATKVDVIVAGVEDAPLDLKHEHTHADGSTHSHSHSHDESHSHEHEHHAHEHGAHTHDGVHRGLREIRAIIEAAAIAPYAKTLALRAFQLLGEAEAKIHNKPVEEIHFHEVGSVDAIVDIVCGAVAVDHLQIERWVCSPLNVGGGTVQCAHGTLPVPAPATLELLNGVPIYSSGIKKELVTPTGAALVRALIPKYSGFPSMIVTATGYGAGAREFPGVANILRVSVGEEVASPVVTRGAASGGDSVTVIEANLDDMSPQLFGYTMEKLLAAGALDVFATPIQMKKNRPGVVLTVLAKPEDAERLSQIIFAETTTIGVRMREESRLTLAREHVAVATPWGEVRIKVASRGGAVTNYAPEFEDCRRLAVEHDVPLKTVMQESIRIYLSEHAVNVGSGVCGTE
jgi:uncharacterized protein (TIGR00299 family) protein